MGRLSVCVGAVCVTAVIAACSSSRGDLWENLTPDLDRGGTGVSLYDSIESIKPDGPGGENKFAPADAIIRGHVSDVTPGIGYGPSGNLDSPSAIPLAFDDPGAAARVVILKVEISRVVRGALRPDEGTDLLVQWLLPEGRDFEDVRESMTGKEDVVFFVSPAAERHRANGQEVLDEKFEESTYVVIGGAALVEKEGAVATPLWTEDQREERLSKTPGESLDSIEQAL